MANEPCAVDPVVLASRVRTFGLMVVRVYGKRRMRKATEAELARAYAVWGQVAPHSWPGYHGVRIAQHDASWFEFLGRELPATELVLGPAGARVA